MKISSTLIILLMAAQWLDLALSEVRCALVHDGKERAKLLQHARTDAGRFRSYAAIWLNAIQANPTAA